VAATDVNLTPLREELLAIYKGKYFRFGEPGWGPKMRLAHDYFSPDDYYEALVARLVVPGADWADIGCGRDLFPSNPDLARLLSERANFLYGIDPDPNVLENEFVDDRFHGLVEDCPTTRQFDVVTLRMVAEHITDPDRAVGRISRMLKPGGCMVIYTPYKWAPMSVIATLLPFSLHHPLKRLIWDAQARDTFPTAYRLNTRADLARHAATAGLSEVHFQFLDDCRVLGRYRALNWCELRLQKVLRSVGLHYPEKCILAAYRKDA
jgi:SAM-dependent methyltransferase